MLDIRSNVNCMWDWLNNTRSSDDKDEELGDEDANLIPSLGLPGIFEFAWMTGTNIANSITNIIDKDVQDERLIIMRLKRFIENCWSRGKQIEFQSVILNHLKQWNTELVNMHYV